MITNRRGVESASLEENFREVREMLTDAQNLINQALCAHDMTRAEPSVVTELSSEESKTSAVVRHFLMQLRNRPASVDYVAGFVGDSWTDVRLLQLEQHLLDSAATVRTLVGSELCSGDTARVKQYESWIRRGAHVRIIDERLPQFALLDRAMVVVRMAGAVDTPFLAIWDAQLVRVMGDLFDALFKRAIDLSVVSRLESVSDDTNGGLSRVVRVLELLDAGYTDEAAARRLGVSVRTFRRYVAHAMVMLDSSSRFQAGARAATFQLIPSCRWSATNSMEGSPQVSHLPGA